MPERSWRVPHPPAKARITASPAPVAHTPSAMLVSVEEGGGAAAAAVIVLALIVVYFFDLPIPHCCKTPRDAELEARVNQPNPPALELQESHSY